MGMITFKIEGNVMFAIVRLIAKRTYIICRINTVWQMYVQYKLHDRSPIM